MSDINKTVLIDIKLEQDAARQAAIKLKQEIVSLEKEQTKLNKLLKESQARGEGYAKSNDTIAKKLVEVQTKLKGTRGEFNKYTSEVSKGNEVFKKTGGLTKSLTDAMSSMGLTILTVAGAWRILSSATRAVVKDYAEFEKTLANVQTLLTSNERSLRRGGIDIIRKYGLTIKDVNKAMFDAISAGVPAGEAIEFLNEASFLAIGGVTDLRTAVDGLTSVLNAYSLSTDYAREVSDAFYVAQKYGKTTVADLVNNIGRIAPIAKIAGVSFQEMLGSLASLTKGGLNTEESVTILRQAIAALIKPANQAGMILRDASVPTGILAVKTHGLVFALEQLNKAYAENPDAIAKMIPNIRAFTGIAAFNAERLVELKKIIKDVYEDNTSLSRAYAVQMATVQKQWDVAKSSITALRIEIGERLAPVMKQALAQFNEWLDFSEDQADIMENTLRHLSAELSILETTAYTQEQRAMSIKKINEGYANYLPYLLDEKASLEDIKKLQEDVIVLMQSKIIVMRYEQELADAFNAQADAALRLQDVQEQRARKEAGYAQKRLELNDEEREFLMSQFTINENMAVRRLERIKEEGKERKELSHKERKTLIEIWGLLEDYSNMILVSTKYTVDGITEKYKKAAADIKVVWADLWKETKKGEEDLPTGDIDFEEARKLAAKLIAIQRKLVDAEIAVMESGLEKKLAIEHIRHSRMLEDLAKEYIQVVDSAGKKRELGKKELEFNNWISNLIEAEKKVHLQNIYELEKQHHDKFLEDKLKMSRKIEDAEVKVMQDAILKKMAQENYRHSRMLEDLAKDIIVKENLSKEEVELNELTNDLILAEKRTHLNNVLVLQKEYLDKFEADKQKQYAKDARDEEARLRDIETFNKGILAYRRTYGLDDTKKQYELDVKAFEESEYYKTLTTEEQERARSDIRKRYNEEYVQLVLATAQNLINMIGQANTDSAQRRYDHNLRMLEDEKEAEEQILQNQLEKNLLSDERYRKRSEALAEEFEEKRIRLEKDKFKEDQNRSIIMAIINGALAITKTLAEYGGTPIGWGAAAAVAIETLASIAIISAEKYAKGKAPDEGYVVKGTGTWNSDSIPALLSPGEGVLNAKSMANPALRAQASAINVAGGGKAFAYGGIATTSTTGPVYSESNMAELIYKSISRMPNPIVFVKDIRTGVEKQIETEVRATY